MSRVTVGVPRERGPGETRVAVVPDTAAVLVRSGMHVVVESGAGKAAGFPDLLYRQAGAEVRSEAGPVDVLVGIGTARPPEQGAPPLVLGLLDDRYTRDWAGRGIVGLDLHRIPRSLARARQMDAFASQAVVSGYKAAVLAADTYGAFFPKMGTGSGTLPPARVLVLGTGAGGMQAIATSRRLGASVTGYDVRHAARLDARSLGARVLDLPGVVDAPADDGDAPVQTERERREEKTALADRMAGFDILITCAELPGRRPPELVDARALGAMEQGSVVVDTAAGPLGGNVAGSFPGVTVERANGVVIVGAANLPRRLPRAASAAFSHAVLALLEVVVGPDGLRIDPGDDVVGPMLVGAAPTVVAAAGHDPTGLR